MCISSLKRLNFFVLLPTLALLTIGTLAVWSAGNARSELLFHGVWKDHLVTALVGLGLSLVIALTDYRKVLAFAAVPAYVLSLVFLVAVLVFGSSVYGGRRWLWFFQPSEVAKLGVLLLLASLQVKDSLVGFLKLAVLVAGPVLLILVEPDLGTALTLVPTALVMMLMKGVWRRGLLTVIFVAGFLALLVLGAVYEAERPGVMPERRERIMRYVPLRDHQVRRLRVFLFPEEDQQGSGYNLRQAKISIGSGGFAGKGLGRGETNHLKYLPQSVSMNDFIFCVYAEETGFIGSVVLLALFGILFAGGYFVAFRAADDEGCLLAAGLVTLLFLHVYVNIAMSIGMVPITGLPLPFISSGRTFLIVVLCGLGFIQSIALHKESEK